MIAPRRSALLGGFLGLGLLGVSFIGWFEAGGDSANLWQSFSLVDVVTGVAIAGGILAGLAAVRPDSSGVAVTSSTVETGLAAIALVLLGYRLIDPPGDGVERELGIWLGVALTAGIALANLKGMQES